MRVKFIGNPIDPNDNRGFIVWAGERFDLNIARDLPEGPVFAKIPTNAHFQVVEDDAPKAPAAVESAASDLPSKSELIAFAEENGVKIDKRWSPEKISAAIEAAANQESA
jgi:hypothetical protein